MPVVFKATLYNNIYSIFYKTRALVRSDKECDMCSPPFATKGMNICFRLRDYSFIGVCCIDLLDNGDGSVDIEVISEHSSSPFDLKKVWKIIQTVEQSLSSEKIAPEIYEKRDYAKILGHILDGRDLKLADDERMHNVDVRRFLQMHREKITQQHLEIMCRLSDIHYEQWYCYPGEARVKKWCGNLASYRSSAREELRQRGFLNPELENDPPPRYERLPDISSGDER